MNISLDKKACKTNYSGMFTNVTQSISPCVAGSITYDEVIPRVTGKRGRKKLLAGEIEDIKRTEEDWLLAHGEVCHSRGKMNVSYVVMNAKDYQIETSHHRLVFSVVDNIAKEEYLWFKSCTNMLHPDYADELSRRFKALDGLSGLGVTFTKKASPYTSVKHDYNILMKAFSSIVEKIINLRWVVAHHTVNGKRVVDRKETKRLRDKKREEIKALNESMGLNGDKIEWFRVSEVGKDNYMCHIHAIIYGLNFIPIAWLKKEWHKLTGDSYMVWVSPRNKKASKHAVKYLTKNISPEHNLSTSLAMLWALNARAWGCSRSLLTKIHKQDKRLILDDMGLSGDDSRYTIKCLGLYLGGEYSGIYKIVGDPPPWELGDE